MKFAQKVLGIAILLLFTVQCEVIDSDLLESPNAPTPDQVDPDFLLNNIQMQARSVHRSAASLGSEMSRMRYMFGDTYSGAYTPQSFNTYYQNSYSSVLIDVNNLLAITDEEELYFHSGMAKILKAYTLIVLVDNFGDVPYEQALLGSEVFNPQVDPGESVYNAALDLLEEAKADLANEDRIGMPNRDLYYPGLSTADKVDRWTRVANTIKLKAYLNTGNVAAINDLIAENMLISAPAHNFTFEYSTTRTNPDSRHPSFTNNYVDLASDYMSVSYMNMMVNDKHDEFGRDPRMRYYFYRQSTSDADDINDNTCLGASTPGHFQSSDPHCLIDNGEGYWGRDHLIDDGIPPDGGLRTTFGVYPAGGEYDSNLGISVDEDMGLEGAGFDPILMSSFTHFMLAEAQTTLGADGDARASFETAVEQSLEAVQDFGEPVAAGNVGEITADVISDYLDVVMARWDDAGYDNVRNISKEYYFALWPNGYEAYNLMRRTGYPNREDNLQPARTSNPGNWYYSFIYPANLVDRNSNVSQKDRTERVFWNEGATFNFDF
ncbi:SusD/RagB family nutrient-binding outer membrane lipoprotein [Rhodohalobacter sp. SW132]|uniref:SusD/RagB family nutrient-binding outer membrane lipoprotein n=1 Tax=Rhodohalobacter sp. SW132 TaxID=2293433 RepID=UPI000E27A334|nr:SusD/RagB family nutrient-binding outer membrane lipoprotein [Rhodohalobacter sp. SW132]REL29107.1 SusD/RagB family nutrient-binding outer membrane lipoprotein [Rhodohalobacter sp. SW132]